MFEELTLVPDIASNESNALSGLLVTTSIILINNSGLFLIASYSHFQLYCRVIKLVMEPYFASIRLSRNEFCHASKVRLLAAAFTILESVFRPSKHKYFESLSNKCCTTRDLSIEGPPVNITISPFLRTSIS